MCGLSKSHIGRFTIKKIYNGIFVMVMSENNIKNNTLKEMCDKSWNPIS